MGEPLARMDMVAAGVLGEAALRLERALETLVTALGRSPGGALDGFHVVELQTARRRSRELETAAAEPAQTLGRAMAEVRRALQEDEAEAFDSQASFFNAGLLDEEPPEEDRLDSPLESDPGLDDHHAEPAEAAPEKEPTQ